MSHLFVFYSDTLALVNLIDDNKLCIFQKLTLVHSRLKFKCYVIFHLTCVMTEDVFFGVSVLHSSLESPPPQKNILDFLLPTPMFSEVTCHNKSIDRDASLYPV